MNITPLNTTIAFDKNNNSFFNTGCIDEINKFKLLCEHFQADILSNTNSHFKLFLIALIIFVIINFVFESFVNENWKYYKLIKGRLVWITFLLAICTTTFFFM